MSEDSVLYQKLCRLRELFSGRYTTDEIAAILNHNNDHLDSSVKFILNNEAHVIRQFLETERNSWETIEEKTKRLKKEPRGQMNVLDRARSGQISTDARLYACFDCDNFWWRRTPQRKKVSRCHRCRKRYDPVPRDKEWGWAEFKCPHHDCGREFGGWCAIYMTSPCYGCSRLISPTRICPNEKRSNGPNKTLHSCAAPDCPGRARHGGPVGDPTMKCVHPQSRRLRGLPTVINPSDIHDSTGSTVDTFLSQTELLKNPEEFFPSLPGIPEVGHESDEANAGSDKGAP